MSVCRTFRLNNNIEIFCFLRYAPTNKKTTSGVEFLTLVGDHTLKCRYDMRLVIIFLVIYTLGLLRNHVFEIFKRFIAKI